LKRAIDSVLSQTFRDFEIIVIDNHSIDHTDEIIESFNDQRIKFFLIHNNGVIAKSRNLGIKKSKGNYICFLDSDDVFYPSKLARISSCPKQFDFFSHSVHQVNYSLNKKSFYINDSSIRENVDEYLLYGFPFATSSVTIRSDYLTYIGGFDESPSMVACEDFDLWYRCLSQTNKVHFEHEVLGSIEIGQQSESSRNMSLPLTAVLNKHRTSLSAKSVKYFETSCKFYDLKYNFTTFILLLKKIKASEYFYILVKFLPIKFYRYFKNKFKNA
jgi:glycosyltransferase involved in cell wall biosynthesis